MSSSSKQPKVNTNTIREVGIGALCSGKLGLLVGDIPRSYLAARQVVTDFVVPNGSVAVAEFIIQI